MAVIIHITFKETIPGHWLADEDELDIELKNIMPDIQGYTTRGFVDYKGHQIEKIFRCYNSEIPGAKDVIQLNIIPKNL